MLKINISDDLYPNLLRKISNPPKDLYLEGNTDLLVAPSIAIVGSRKPTENGIQIAKKFAIELSKCGITIVSGLAIGIDSTAHSFSYNNAGKTIAVLGSGIERIFPPENIPLAQNILNNNGLLVSEYPPNELNYSRHFTDRNRIISGLSLGVLVVEATYRSGTSITARNAVNQGKPVFSIPHEIWDSHGVGTNKLIKNGAKLVTSSQDILDYLKLQEFKTNYLKFKNKGDFDNIVHFSSNTFQNTSYNRNYIAQEKSKKNSYKIKNKNEQLVYETISKQSSAISINDLMQQTNLSAKDISSFTFMLEINGYIKKVEGGYICL